MTANLIAFLWGLAEATLFFIVPDVWISIRALNGYTVGLEACMYALAGALVGGGLIYTWGKKNLEQILQIFIKIPAIRTIDLERVRADLEKYGAVATIWGPLLGIPYKIYAVYSHLFTSIFMFLLISIPARIVRFVLVALVTPYAMDVIAPNNPYMSQVFIVLVVWAVFYTGYFIMKRKRSIPPLPKIQ